jgi:mRNA interferase MazF
MQNPSHIYIPDTGDIVYIDLNPTKGHEQKGRRPILVLSPKTYNEKSELVIAVPITTSKKNYPFEVEIQTKKINGVILTDQIRSLSWIERHTSFIDKASFETISKVKDLLDLLILKH